MTSERVVGIASSEAHVELTPRSPASTGGASQPPVLKVTPFHPIAGGVEALTMPRWPQLPGITSHLSKQEPSPPTPDIGGVS